MGCSKRKLLSMAVAICSVALPASLLRSCSMASASLLSVVKLSTSQAPSSETGLRSVRSSTRDVTPTPRSTSSITSLPPVCSGRPSAPCSPTREQEAPPLLTASRSSRVSPSLTTTRRESLSRKFCKLGDLAEKMGWTKAGLIDKLEDKRRENAKKFFDLKTKKVNARARSMKDKSVEKFNAELKTMGF